MLRKTALNIVNFGHHLGKFAPKHPFPMKTTFRNCFLINFSMEPEILQKVLPKGLKPDLYQNKAFLSIVIADLEAMRIGFLPRFTGSNFTQVVYRAIIRAPNNERGVYFVRSDADSIWMSITGNIFSNFNFNLADIKWSGKEQLPWIGPGSLDAENLHFHQPTGVEWLPAPEPKINNHHEEGKGQQQQQPIISFSLTPWSQQQQEQQEQQNSPEPARIVASYDFSTTSLTMPSTSLFAGQHVRVRSISWNYTQHSNLGPLGMGTRMI
jgi:hypothetical protein